MMAILNDLQGLIKPEFDGRMFFYLMLLKKFNYHSTISGYETLCLKAYQDVQNDPFWLYLKMGCTHFDQHYFLRRSLSTEIIYEEHQLYYDRRTNALMSAKAARIIGYDLLEKKLYLERLQRDIKTNNAKSTNISTLQWDTSIAAITNLIYALHEYGAFGKSIEIKKIADYFSMAFNIRITNIYKTWEDIRLRKKDRTPFIRSLLTTLHNRIDRDNEFAP